MKLLELFSGTGSVGRPWREARHEVISVDVDGRFGADIVEDILQLSYYPTYPTCSGNSSLTLLTLPTIPYMLPQKEFPRRVGEVG